MEWKFDRFCYRLCEAVIAYSKNLTLSKIVFVAILVFSFCYILKKRKNDLGVRYLAVVFIYGMCLICLTIAGRECSSWDRDISSLFATYYWLQKDFYHAKFDVLFNILLFIPEGILLRYKVPWKKAFIVVMLTTIAIELIQLFFSLGQFEIFDLVNNTLGGLLGIVVEGLLIKLHIKKQLTRR